MEKDEKRREARAISGYKKLCAVAAGVAVALGISFALLAQIDFLGDLVLSELDKAITKQLKAELSISPLEGNPISGFKGKDLALSRSGDKLLTIKEVGIELSLPSLIKNSPRVATLTLDGVSSDVDSINSLLPKKKSSSGKTEIPIDEVIIKDTSIATKWGLANVVNGRVELRNTEWFNLKLEGSLGEVRLSASGVCENRDGLWALDGFKVGVEDGWAKATGAVYPSPDVSVEAHELNLSTVASMLPAVKKYGVKGMLSGRSTIVGLGHSMTARGSGTLSDALIRGIPLEEVGAEWLYDNGLIDVTIGEGKVFKSSLNGHFKLDNRSGDKYLELTANAKELRFADWNDKFNKETSGTTKFIQGGITSLKANLKGPLNALSGSVELAPSDISYHDMKFTRVGGKATFDGTNAGRVDFSALHGGEEITLAGTCSFSDTVPSDLRLHAGKIVLNGLEKAIPMLANYEPKGAAAVDATLSGLVKSWHLAAVVNSPLIEVKHVGPVKNLRTSLEYNFGKDVFTLKSASAVWNSASLTARGSARAVSYDTKLDFSGSFNGVDTKKFYSAFSFLKSLEIDAVTYGTWKVAGTASLPVATARMNASCGRFRAMYVDKFTSDISYSDGVVTLHPMNVAACGGSGLLKCVVRIPSKGSGARTTWAVDGHVEDIDLGVMNGLLKTSQDIGGECAGEIKVFDKGEGLRWSVNLEKGKPHWKNFKAESVSGLAWGSKAEVRLSNLKAGFLKGSHIVNGKVELAQSGKPANEAALDLTVESSKINMYEAIRKYLPSVRGVQGLVKGHVAVTGTAKEPKFVGTATVAPLRYRGFLLPMLDLHFNGNMNGVNVSKADARLRNGSISGGFKAYLKKDNGKWYTDFGINGENVDLHQLGVYLPSKFRSGLDGYSDFVIKGGGYVGKVSAKGTFSSKYMKVMGIRLNNISAPFWISDGYAVMEDVKANSNGGTLAGGVAYDINESRWGGNFTALSIDVYGLTHQAVPDMKGSITGNADLKIRGEGESGRLSTIKGGGVFFLNNGEIASFDAVEAARKFTGGKPLRYDKIQTSFTFDGGNVTILPGSQATAPKGDGVYRYVMLDGTIFHDKKLSMFAMGKVNIRALNALLGAFQGLISVGQSYNDNGKLDRGELLQDFLGGLLSGYTRQDFRFVTMHFGGTTDAPTYDNIKVDKNVKKNTGDSVIPKSAGDPDEKSIGENDMTFRLKFEIPVGPGNSQSPSGNMQGQAAEQALSNLLKNLNLGGGSD